MSKLVGDPRDMVGLFVRHRPLTDPVDADPPPPKRQRLACRHRQQAQPGGSTTTQPSPDDSRLPDFTPLHRPVTLWSIPDVRLPGCTTPNARTMALALHNEIIRWLEWVRPRPHEKRLRELAVERAKTLLGSVCPEARCQTFGSTVTQLVLPGSDVDITVLGVQPNHKEAVMDQAWDVLSNDSTVQRPRILGGRVPVVNYRDRICGLYCDITVGEGNGPRNTALMQDLIRRHPSAVPLILVVKAFLKQRSLHRVHRGGMSSYAACLLVISLHQLHYKGIDADLVPLGQQVLDFLFFYGLHFAYEHCVIHVSEGGAYTRRRKKQDPHAEEPPLLSLIDPQDPSNDVGAVIWNMPKIREVFYEAYRQLTDDVTLPECGTPDDALVKFRCTYLTRILPFSEQDFLDRGRFETLYENHTKIGRDASAMEGRTGGSVMLEDVGYDTDDE